MTRTQRVEKLTTKLQNMVEGVTTFSDTLIDDLMEIIDRQKDREVVYQIMCKNIHVASGMCRMRLQCTVWGY